MTNDVPERTDNSVRDEDGDQDVSQDPNVDYSLESVDEGDDQ